MLRLALDDPRWLAFVAGYGRVPFQDPQWAQLIGDCYGYQTFALVLTDPSGAIVAGLPVVEVDTRLTGRTWVSLPHTDFCPPVTADDRRTDELAQALEATRREAGVKSLDVHWELGGETAHATQDFLLHVLPLEDGHDAIFQRIGSDTRRKVRSARRAGVTVQAGTSREFRDAFYDLQVRTRRRLGVPVQPRRFFTLLWERMLDPGHGVCLLAFADGRPIAGVVCLAGHERVTYKHAASDERLWRLHANHLLVWEAISWSCDRQFDTFDFGRTEVAHEGLRQFKLRWKPTEMPLPYSSFGVPAASRSPFIASAVGAVIRHAPTAVCRLTGELLYKYAL